MTYPLVTICIPISYNNGATFLTECLDSVINQTFKDYEVILGADNSIPGVLSRYLHYRPLKFYAYENLTTLGPNLNWNKCIKLARTKYVKILFQDDFLAPNCLEKMVALAEEKKSGFISCKRSYLFGPNIDADYILSIAKLAEIIPPSEPEYLTKLFSEFPFINFIGEPSAYLVAREVFDVYGFFNEDLAQLQDVEFAMRIASNIGLDFINEELVLINIHKKSLSFNNNRFCVDHIDPIIIMNNILYDPHFEYIKREKLKHDPDYEEKFVRRVKLALASSPNTANGLTMYNTRKKYPEIHKACNRKDIL